MSYTNSKGIHHTVLKSITSVQVFSPLILPWCHGALASSEEQCRFTWWGCWCSLWASSVFHQVHQTWGCVELTVKLWGRQFSWAISWFLWCLAVLGLQLCSLSTVSHQVMIPRMEFAWKLDADITFPVPCGVFSWTIGVDVCPGFCCWAVLLNLF